MRGQSFPVPARVDTRQVSPARGVSRQRQIVSNRIVAGNSPHHPARSNLHPLRKFRAQSRSTGRGSDHTVRGMWPRQDLHVRGPGAAGQRTAARRTCSCPRASPVYNCGPVQCFSSPTREVPESKLYKCASPGFKNCGTNRRFLLRGAQFTMGRSLHSRLSNTGRSRRRCIPGRTDLSLEYVM